MAAKRTRWVCRVFGHDLHVVTHRLHHDTVCRRRKCAAALTGCPVESEREREIIEAGNAMVRTLRVTGGSR